MNKQTENHTIEPCHYTLIHGHTLHYQKIGNGPRLVIAFHGYGGKASQFHFLDSPEWTLLSFDLPLHGDSTGDKDMLISKDQLCAMTIDLMNEHNVQHVYLVGFSMGARFCLCIAEQMPKQIKNMVLIAADGLQPNYFYKFLTQSSLGRALFRGFIRDGNLFILLLSFLKKVKLIPKSRYKFLVQYIQTKPERALLYNVWCLFKDLIPNMDLVVKNTKKYKLDLHLIMGDHDVVISPRNAKRLSKKSAFIHLHLFERGHNLMRYPEVKGTIISWILGEHKNANK